MLARQETEWDTILARRRAEYHTNLARQRTELQQRHAEFIEYQRVAMEQFERDLLVKVDNIINLIRPEELAFTLGMCIVAVG